MLYFLERMTKQGRVFFGEGEGGEGQATGGCVFCDLFFLRPQSLVGHVRLLVGEIKSKKQKAKSNKGQQVCLKKIKNNFSL